MKACCDICKSTENVLVMDMEIINPPDEKNKEWTYTETTRHSTCEKCRKSEQEKFFKII